MKSRFLSLLAFGAMLIAGLSSASAMGASCGCEAAAPSCCEPSCCETSCCRPGLFSRLHSHLSSLKCNLHARRCCKPSCCEPTCEPTCEAPACAAPACAAPACAAPAAPSCGCDAAPACGCETSCCAKKCRVSLCDRIKSLRANRCCKPSCCESSCGGCGAVEATCGCN